jgi:hypothetical protein
MFCVNVKEQCRPKGSHLKVLDIDGRSGDSTQGQWQRLGGQIPISEIGLLMNDAMVLLKILFFAAVVLFV